MRTRSYRRPARWLLLLAACGCAGDSTTTPDLGRPLYPVEGKIFVGGKPAENALVIFSPLDEASRQMEWPGGFPRGRVDAAGGFRLATLRDDDGAPAGEYAVLVIWEQPDERGSERDRLDGKYADPMRPRLRARVSEGTNSLAAFRLD